jgi:hypothetical protein
MGRNHQGTGSQDEMSLREHAPYTDIADQNLHKQK